MKIQKTVSIKDVAKIRDKLVELFQKEIKSKFSDIEAELDFEEVRETYLTFAIEQLEEEFDFDGEEEHEI